MGDAFFNTLSFFQNRGIIKNIRPIIITFFAIVTLLENPHFLRTTMNQSISKKNLFSLSLAIFCMLFGAGNLIYPLAMGRSAGGLAAFGMIGFFITAILLPLAGLIGMILFDGNYTQFFNRLGKVPGSLLIFISMLI